MDDQVFADALLTGTSVREYVIEKAIGQGGYGVVYRASHRYLGSVVALKEYFPTELAVRTNGTVRPRNRSATADYEEGLRRFMEEARRLEQFRSHPGVVTCMGFFEERGTAYLAMEYEDGMPLSELLAKREAAASPLAEDELLKLAEQLLECLSEVHEAGVLHRDIKPSNILVRRSDERPVLIDFGAAKTEFAQHTKSYAPQTKGYSAIEQVEEDGELGPWTDLYGLGAVLWRIVAGGHRPQERLVPVDAQSRMLAIHRGQDDPQPLARELGAGRFSSGVLDAIDRCLQLEPEDRPADCGGVLALLSAPVRLGGMYYWGEGVPQDRAHAAEWYRKAADQGDAVARQKLGFMNFWGLGVPQDRALAAMWYRKAADDGDTEAQLWLAYMYHWGAGVQQDRAQVEELVQKARDRGDAIVQWFLHQSYRDEHHAREPALALEWYRKASDDGDPEAQVWLADSCRSPKESHEVALAVKLYGEAAKQGFSVAQARLGDMFRLGEQVEQDFRLARMHYRRAAEDGDAAAQWKLGEMYDELERQFVWTDRELAADYLSEAAEWYHKAAHQGDARAQATLAEMYHSGRGAPHDDTLAAIWFGKACEQGDGWQHCKDGLVRMFNSPSGAKALVAEWFPKAAEHGQAIAPGLMGDVYRDIEGVGNDAARAAEWYRKAADQDDPDAQGTIGFMYYRGEGVPEDRALAAEWLGRAAEQGNIWAQEWLSDIDHGGEHIPMTLAADWYRKAASPQQWLGEVMCRGGVDIRETASSEWLRRAADMGSAVAQGLMGDLYYSGEAVDGEWVSEDYALAAEWYRKSAEQGNAWAQQRLGEMYHRGEGVPLDTAIAVEWWGQAAEQGNTEAQEWLAHIWHESEGTPKVLAAEWLRKAADRGNAVAQRLMGDLYREGEGVRRDTALAADWYRKAADQDDREALTRLGAMLHESEACRRVLRAVRSGAARQSSKVLDSGQCGMSAGNEN